MESSEAKPDLLGEPIHDLAQQEGILGVSADPEHGRLEIEFDPEEVSESELRKLATKGAGEMSMELRKLSFRLDSAGCEAGALKLEKKVGKTRHFRPMSEFSH